MKALHRYALTAGSVFALVGATAVVTPAHAQRTIEPDARVLVATFRSADRGLGVAGADAIRTRVQQEVPVRQLFVIKKENINETLEASGYRPDSALSANDTRELARLMRADEIIDGTVTKTADGGVRVEARLALARDVSLSQPLPPAEARNVGDAARQIARDVKEARKQLDANKKCEQALREQKWDEAMRFANEGIGLYAQSTLARLCLATALKERGASADEVLAVTNRVIEIDPKSKHALGLAHDAYNTKGDSAQATEMLVQLFQADPTNVSLLVDQIIPSLVRAGNPDRAISIVDTLVVQNPGDPSLLRTQWLVLLNAQQYRRAIEVGEQLVSLDTAAATADYFARTVGALAADSQYQRAAEVAARAAQRFPTNATFLMQQGQLLRSLGQLPQAVAVMQRAYAIDPLVQNGALFIIVGLGEQGMADSALAFATTAIAGGADRESIGSALLGAVGPAVQKAQDSKLRADWQSAMAMAQAVDRIAPSANSKYFLGVSAFQVGLDALQKLEQTKSCAEARLIEDVWATAQMAMPAGASVSAETAGQIMGLIQQYSAPVGQYRRQLCGR
ncbi:MAG: hypothetical protein H0X64_00890 [Gemmatimonadaceae bacterium]|nr:hypothetical protein [Gemmatimonadaceae bacterium]